MLWVKLHAKFLEWEWHDSPETVSLFIHLIVLANTEDKKWHGIEIKRGQLVTGLKKLSGYTGLSVQQIRTCLGRLKSTNEITINSTNKFSVITVCNYATYQDKNDDSQQTNQQAAQQSNNKQSTTTIDNKRYIKEKSISDDILKEKNDLPDDIPTFDDVPPTPSPSPVTPEEFVRMWNEGRGNCPKVIKLSDKRKAKAKIRISEFGKTREEQERVIRDLMKNIRESNFLQYQWTCNFEWLIENSDNWVKVLEGNYRNKKQVARNTSEERMDKFAEELKKVDEIFENGAAVTDIPDEQ